MTTAPFIPDSAPFTAPQRAWLNGFFAGMLSAGQPVGAVATLDGTMAGETPAPQEEEDHPWHDAALSLEERLKLAEGRPLASRLMAAMAQLDCGACGYVCQSYSAAIAAGKEQDLTRCSPGGTDTAKALKRLLSIERSTSGATNLPVGNALRGIPSPANYSSNGSANGHAAPPKYSRTNPFPARIHSSTRLTHLDSPKDTRHVVIELLDSGLTYEPGDALGICPVNCPDLVKSILQELRASGEEIVTTEGGASKPLRQALATDFTLARTPPSLFELLAASAKDPREAAQLEGLAKEDGGPLAGADVCEVLERFPSARPAPAEFAGALRRLQPRLYSISSSLRRHPGQVHLTVGVVRFESAGRWRNGVASHFLGVRSNPGDEVRIFVQPSHKFRLPDDPATPIIMVGPGTGIAPFLSFLQEREATGAAGKNWLFFGNQHFAYDYLYREELDRWADGGLLTRLDVAFSRDSTEKVYVQDRMRQQGAELRKWLEAGAYFYVCGDAKRMAPDVDAALQQIAAEHGGLTAAEAKAFVARLAKDGRYRKDVY